MAVTAIHVKAAKAPYNYSTVGVAGWIVSDSEIAGAVLSSIVSGGGPETSMDIAINETTIARAINNHRDPPVLLVGPV